MKYLLSNGNITSEKEASIMDFLKVNLLLSKGAIFNNIIYGYTYFNPNDTENVKNQIMEIINTLGYNLAIESVNIIKDKCIVVKFQGLKDNLVLNTNED